MARDQSVEQSATAAEVDLFPEDPRFRQMRRLVNLLLIVMIGGFLTIVVAVLWKLKDAPSIGVAPLRANERVISSNATSDRVSLTLQDQITGAQRVIILDGESFKPIAEITAGPEGD